MLGSLQVLGEKYSQILEGYDNPNIGQHLQVGTHERTCVNCILTHQTADKAYNDLLKFGNKLQIDIAGSGKPLTGVFYTFNFDYKADLQFIKDTNIISAPTLKRLIRIENECKANGISCVLGPTYI